MINCSNNEKFEEYLGKTTFVYSQIVPYTVKWHLYIGHLLLPETVQSLPRATGRSTARFGLWWAQWFVSFDVASETSVGVGSDGRVIPRFLQIRQSHSNGHHHAQDQKLYCDAKNKMLMRKVGTKHRPFYQTESWITNISICIRISKMSYQHKDARHCGLFRCSLKAWRWNSFVQQHNVELFIYRKEITRGGWKTPKFPCSVQIWTGEKVTVYREKTSF